MLKENNGQAAQETEMRRTENAEISKLQKRLDEINSYRGDAL